MQAFELDLCDPDSGGHIGGLQMMVTNEGRRIPQGVLGEIASRTLKTLPFNAQNPAQTQTYLSPPKAHHKKKVQSKPLTMQNLELDRELNNLA